jgi:hypothetical protein
MVEVTILKELKSIKKDLEFIKEHMVDKDSIMTEDDYATLQEYREQKKKRTLTSHEELVKELT